MTLPWGPYRNVDADACHGLVAGSRDSIGLVHVHQDDPSVERSNEKQSSPAHAIHDSTWTTSTDYLPPGDVINTQSRFPQQTGTGPMRTSDSRVGSRKESEGMPSKQRSLSSSLTGYDTRLLKCAATKEKASGDKSKQGTVFVRQCPRERVYMRG